AGNNPGYTQVSDSECNMPCSANSSETCGGTWRNSIYSTRVSSTSCQPLLCPPPPIAYGCTYSYGNPTLDAAGCPIACGGITVNCPTSSPSISVNTSQVAPGGTVTVSVSGGPANPGDWVGLFDVSDVDPTSWGLGGFYLNGQLTKPT